MPRNEETEWYKKLTRDLAGHLERVRKEIDDFETRICREILPLLADAVDRATKPNDPKLWEVRMTRTVRFHDVTRVEAATMLEAEAIAKADFTTNDETAKLLSLDLVSTTQVRDDQEATNAELV